MARGASPAPGTQHGASPEGPLPLCTLRPGRPTGALLGRAQAGAVGTKLSGASQGCRLHHGSALRTHRCWGQP